MRVYHSMRGTRLLQLWYIVLAATGFAPLTETVCIRIRKVRLTVVVADWVLGKEIKSCLSLERVRLGLLNILLSFHD